MAKKIDIAASVLSTPTAHVSRETKDLVKEKIAELIKEETVIVRGIFQCFESPGATATITCRKYPGVQMFSKTMKDGNVYDIPKYVARFLNGTDVSAGAVDNPNKGTTLIGTCGYGVHGFKMDPQGELQQSREDNGIAVPIVGITKTVRRYGFQSTDFGGAA
jgi:hypothetical protein